MFLIGMLTSNDLIVIIGPCTEVYPVPFYIFFCVQQYRAVTT